MKLSERIKELENVGIDTSKYTVSLEGLRLTKKEEEIANIIVEDKQVNNKAFRRWITAQTFRMLNENVYNPVTNQYEHSWDAYLRINYPYKYQFTMMMEELKVLNRLELTDRDEFEERKVFFNKDVVIATCNHYLYQLDKYITKHINEKKKTIKLANYGIVNVDELNTLFIDKLVFIVNDMKYAEKYSELYTLLKVFIRHMNKLPQYTPKCSKWKDAFKGSGAYYTLKNLILFHDVLLRGCRCKEDSLDFLKELKNKYTLAEEHWRLHMLLKDTIEYNNFDLRKSIEYHK